jgi:predicted transcriptional regulator
MYPILNEKVRGRGITMRRSKFEIISEILAVSMNNGVNITKIVYKVNLNFKMAQEYISYLVENEFLEEVTDGTKKKYRTTEKGRDFIRKFREACDALP